MTALRQLLLLLLPLWACLFAPAKAAITKDPEGAAFRATTQVRATIPAEEAPGGVAQIAETTVYNIVPPAVEILSYDFAGRLEQDAFWTYQWDSLNRLTTMDRKLPMTQPDSVSEKLTYVYDSDGRCVKRTFTRVTATGSRIDSSRIFWAGWLPVVEERTTCGTGQPTTTNRRWFQWGPDRSGTLDGAGGIGGLMAVHEEAPDGSIARTILPVDDGLGNIVALLNAATGARIATFEYGPFGEPLMATGEVDACPFRWQTKWYDPHSQQYYFGYRHYDPRYGRWLSRDPLGEAGGFNLYAYCGNDPVNRHDPLGLEESSERWGVGDNGYFRLAYQGHRWNRQPTCKRINPTTGKPEVWANYYTKGFLSDTYTHAGWVDATSLGYPALVDSEFSINENGGFSVRSLGQQMEDSARFTAIAGSFVKGADRAEARFTMATAPAKIGMAIMLAGPTFGVSLWGAADGVDSFISARETLRTGEYQPTVLQQVSSFYGGDGLGGL